MVTNKTEPTTEDTATAKSFPDHKTLHDFDVTLQAAQAKLRSVQEEIAQALAASKVAKTPQEQIEVLRRMSCFPGKISETQGTLLTTAEDIVARFTQKTD